MTRCNGRKAELRVATWNVVSLPGRLVAVCRRARRLGIQILCLQEVRVPPSQRKAVISLAGKFGWTLHLSDELADKQGNPTAGTAILERVGAMHAESDFGMPGRVCRVKMETKDGPLDVYSVYIHASEHQDGTMLIEAILESSAAKAETAIILGDWNREPMDYPLGRALRTQHWNCLDDLSQSFKTRGNTGYLDYAIASDGIVATDRSQHCPFWSDHDLVAYNVDLCLKGTKRVKPRPKQFE